MSISELALNVNYFAILIELFLIIVLVHKGRLILSSQFLITFFIAQLAVSISYIVPAELRCLQVLWPLGLISSYIWGPCIYLYALAVTNPKFKITRIHTLHFSPVILLLILYVILFSYILQEKNLKCIFDLYKWLSHIRVLQVFIYSLLSIIVIYKHNKRLQPVANKELRSRLTWNKFIIYGYFIACRINNIGLLDMVLTIQEKLHLISNAVFFVFFSTILYKALIGSHITNHLDDTRNLSFSYVEGEKLLGKIATYMQNNQPFLRANISVKDMAKELEIKERTLSETINFYTNQNFRDFINFYRIKFAKELLKDSLNSEKIILDIIYESGFNSKGAFNIAFKKHTGLTPTEYRNKLKQE